MAEALSIITSIAVVLLVGIILSVISKKLKIPEVLVLITAGICIGEISYKGAAVIDFPFLFLTSVSLLALALIVFDSAVKLRLKELDTGSWKAIKFVIIFSVFLLLFFSIASYLLLGIPFVLAVMFAAINIGTSPEAVFAIMRGVKSRVVGILNLESVFNTPLTVLLPFLVLDFVQGKTEALEPMSLIVPFLTKIIVGIGAGVFIGVILFKIMQKQYSPLYSPLAVIVASVLAYVLAENLGGNGVLAVVVLGVFFGNAYVRDKIQLLSVESVLTKAFFIFVFILLGLTLKVPFSMAFLINSVVLFGVYLLLRFLAAVLSFRKEKFSVRELAFIALNAPKGISTAAVVFLFAIYAVPGLPYHIPGIDLVLNLTLVFILYSIILSAIVCTMQNFFLKSK